MKECESTNSYLKENPHLIKKERPVAVTAFSQSCGRGRESREWLSLPGKGLYISFGYRFPLQPNLNFLSIVAGLGVYETVLLYLREQEVVVKWPNDILVNGRKIAGILIENSIIGDELVSIIGVGLNVNHCEEDYPEDLKNIATSIYRESDKIEDIEEIKMDLGSQIDTGIEMLLKGETKAVISSYRKATSLMEGREITFHNQGIKEKAVFRGIDDSGAVILETERGELFNSFSGEFFLED